MAKGTCSVPGCDRHEILRKGMCEMHYRRWKIKGDPGVPGSLRIIGDDWSRFWSHVNKDGPGPNPPAVGCCWVWTALCNEDGYGQFRLQGRTVSAHRFSLSAHAGPIPDEFEVDHLCRIRPCVRPTHLEAVSGTENKRRANIVRAGGIWWQLTGAPSQL